MSETIRQLFSTDRKIDRPIEKVIDYQRDDPDWLEREIKEYEVTDNVEACFKKFVEHFGAGVRTGDITEVGIWVSGFYGSGKSSFTKYLGFALDPERKVNGTPFIDLLGDRLKSPSVKSELNTLAKNEPTAVIMLDLGAEQLADTATAPVTKVLYWKVLQKIGFSKEKKLAELEFRLDKEGRYEDFQKAYKKKFPGKGEWDEIHNDPLIAMARADQLVPEFFSEYQPGEFRSTKFELELDVRDLAERMVDLVRRHFKHQNVLFLIDEAGQYVAPRGELILNLDGLARNLKELGKGRVWIAATGQQTLQEIVEQAAYNSAELNKLRDRFPISIQLDARDIKEITYLRLLTKDPDSQKALKKSFDKQGQKLIAATKLEGWSLFKADLDPDTFAKFYPFLPQHFDLLMELIRTLARSTGGIGLRSAIRVIQDLLVDISRSLPAGKKPLADRAVGTLACADDFFDTLRNDIGKVLPHVLNGIEKVERIFADDPFTVRVAKSIAALQPLQEHFPRTEENIAALLYPKLGEQPQDQPVKDSLAKLIREKESGLVNDPQTGGYGFLSEGIKVYRDKRNEYNPTGGEINRLRSQLLARIFEQLPSSMLENIKKVEAGICYQKTPVVGEGNDIQIRIEPTSAESFAARREDLLLSTNNTREFANTVALLVTLPDEIEEKLIEARRSDFIIGTIPERDADKDVAQFLRSERALMNKSQEDAQKLIEQTLLQQGLFIFKSQPKPVKELGNTLDAACRQIVGDVAKTVFPKFQLAPIRPNTDIAAKFLEVERLDRMPSDKDPLQLVAKVGGKYAVQTTKDVLVEALRCFAELAEASGSGRIQGKVLQDRFFQSEYGWTKDATRYIFAALFRAGEVQLHTGEGTVTTPGPQAIEAFKSTASFNRAGVSIRDSRPPLDAMDRAARRLEELFAIEVLPLEEHISRAVRTHIPTVLESVGSLPDRLRLLQLPGRDRAQQLLQTCADLLKEDASGAAMVLGASDCKMPADIEWSKSILKALSDDGERLIREAQKQLDAIDELDELFNGESSIILEDDQRETVETIKQSENFFEQLPALRGAVRRINENIAARFTELRQQFDDQLEDARNELEGLPDWVKLSPDDRQDIAGRMTSSELPSQPRPDRELADLRLLLTRRMGLAGLMDTLSHEVQQRVPEEQPEEESSEEESEKIVNISSKQLVEPVTITAENLDEWISDLRERLVTLLSEYKEIHFKD
jgi:hypothetical protein